MTIAAPTVVPWLAAASLVGFSVVAAIALESAPGDDPPPVIRECDCIVPAPDLARRLTAVHSVTEADRWQPPPTPPPTSSEPINRALYAQSHDIDGCFEEWAERQNGDTRLMVHVIITDDGVGHKASASFPDLSPNDKEQVGVLPTCVAPAILRVKFPTLARDYDAQIAITWVDKTLGFSTFIQPHEAASGGLNL